MKDVVDFAALKETILGLLDKIFAYLYDLIAPNIPE